MANLSTASPVDVLPAAETAELSCFHCGLPVVEPGAFTLVIDQQEQEFCCPGCQAIASAIDSGGLGDFYQYRSTLNSRPETVIDNFSIYDEPSIQQSFVSHAEGEEPCADLILEGITCAACVWLIEKHLEQLPGILRVHVNSVTHQCLVTWDAKEQQLSLIMAALAEIGYRPQPALASGQKHHQQQQQRLSLMRLAVAAFGMMQVGMVAIALYAGAIQGIDAQWQWLLRWTSLIVATPVVFFSAKPFWQSAWRSLRNRHLTMDVPVSLAILLAYFASVWATFYNTGEVYFDSVSMFTFFLLLGRYLEMRARAHNWQMTGNMTRLLPMTAMKVSTNEVSEQPGSNESYNVDVIPLERIVVGDTLRIGSGDTLPCDGIVLEGHSAVIESLITGEAEPVSKTQGDEVIAGTLNTDGSLLIEVTAVGQQTRLSTIEQLVSQAQQEKPKTQIIADQLSSYFVAAVLVVATCVFAFWWFYEPQHAFWIMLSVLVVTCPCALSLATPTALTAAVAGLRQCGLLVLKGHVLEALCRIDTVIFDKTGTLTYGEPKVEDVILLDQSIHKEHVLAIAAALEEGANHPIAKAFNAYQGTLRAFELEVVTGAGVIGTIGEHHYRLGKPEFAVNNGMQSPGDGQWLLLSQDGQPQAWIGLQDQLRESAVAAVSALRQKGIRVEILSGDTESVVSSMAAALGDIPYRADATPEAKLDYIQQLQQQQHVLMVGDGINDVPVLAAADVSVAMDTASDFAQAKADAVLLNGNLSMLIQALNIANRCRGIIKQNLGWALLYNLLALPLAAAGFIPPYLAAIGMSLSSLIVVFNAMRLYKV